MSSLFLSNVESLLLGLVFRQKEWKLGILLPYYRSKIQGKLTYSGTWLCFLPCPLCGRFNQKITVFFWYGVEKLETMHNTEITVLGLKRYLFNFPYCQGYLQLMINARSSLKRKAQSVLPPMSNHPCPSEQKMLSLVWCNCSTNCWFLVPSTPLPGDCANNYLRGICKQLCFFFLLFLYLRRGVSKLSPSVSWVLY